MTLRGSVMTARETLEYNQGPVVVGAAAQLFT